MKTLEKIRSDSTGKEREKTGKRPQFSSFLTEKREKLGTVPNYPQTSFGRFLWRQASRVSRIKNAIDQPVARHQGKVP